MVRYDSYKDSEVEWIGEIPNHWTKIKLSYLMEDDGFRSGPFGSTLITSQLLDKGRVQVFSPEFIHKGREEFPLFVPKERENELSKYLVKEGDIVIPIVGTIGRGKVIHKDDPEGILNQRLCRITPNKNKVNLSLLHLLLTESNLVKVQYQLEKRGSILDHITKEILFNFQLPIPPLSEQQQIVSFLDTKTSLIDSLIEKTQRKIELLKEKRTSLINEVVTKGLNPNVEMKDSGVEWIGKIPSHWFINKVGNNTYVKGRIGWKGLRSEDFKEQGPYLITGTDFNKDGTINWDNMYHVDQWRYDEDPFIQLQDNDVLITKDGTIGKVVYVGNLKGQTCLNSGIFLTRPTNNEYKSRFFFWLLNSNVFKVFVDYNSGGSTIQHLYQNVFVNFKFPIPPLSEQQQIVEYLDDQTQKIDKNISIQEKRIGLLKEYRQSLISEVVTGKRKVVE